MPVPSISPTQSSLFDSQQQALIQKPRVRRGRSHTRSVHTVRRTRYVRPSCIRRPLVRGTVGDLSRRRKGVAKAIIAPLSPPCRLPAFPGLLLSLMMDSPRLVNSDSYLCFADPSAAETSYTCFRIESTRL